MEDSMRLLGTERIDLMQVHNLIDLDNQLATLREWKAAGRIRYLEITHWTRGSLDGLAAIITRENIDFVQFAYSIATRDAERRLLPLCAEHGVATLINRPYVNGQLFRRARGHAVLGHRRARLRQLGTIFPEVHPRPSPSDLRHPGNQQAAPRARQRGCRDGRSAKRGPAPKNARRLAEDRGGLTGTRECVQSAMDNQIRRRRHRAVSPVPRARRGRCRHSRCSGRDCRSARAGRAFRRHRAAG